MPYLGIPKSASRCDHELMQPHHAPSLAGVLTKILVHVGSKGCESELEGLHEIEASGSNI